MNGHIKQCVVEILHTQMYRLLQLLYSTIFKQPLVEFYKFKNTKKRSIFVSLDQYSSRKIKTGYLYSGTVSFTATGGCRLFCSALSVLRCLAATHLSSPDVVNGPSWPKPQCTCNAMGILARYSTAPKREYYAVIQRAQC